MYALCGLKVLRRARSDALLVREVGRALSLGKRYPQIDRKASPGAGWGGPESTRPQFGLLGQMEGVSKHVHLSEAGLNAQDRADCIRRVAPVLVLPESAAGFLVTALVPLACGYT